MSDLSIKKLNQRMKKLENIQRKHLEVTEKTLKIINENVVQMKAQVLKNSLNIEDNETDLEKKSHEDNAKVIKMSIQDILEITEELLVLPNYTDKEEIIGQDEFEIILPPNTTTFKYTLEHFHTEITIIYKHGGRRISDYEVKCSMGQKHTEHQALTWVKVGEMLKEFKEYRDEHYPNGEIPVRDLDVKIVNEKTFPKVDVEIKENPPVSMTPANTAVEAEGFDPDVITPITESQEPVDPNLHYKHVAFGWRVDMMEILNTGIDDDNQIVRTVYNFSDTTEVKISEEEQEDELENKHSSSMDPHTSKIVYISPRYQFIITHHHKKHYLTCYDVKYMINGNLVEDKDLMNNQVKELLHKFKELITERSDLYEKRKAFLKQFKANLKDSKKMNIDQSMPPNGLYAEVLEAIQLVTYFRSRGNMSVSNQKSISAELINEGHRETNCSDKTTIILSYYNTHLKAPIVLEVQFQVLVDINPKKELKLNKTKDGFNIFCKIGDAFVETATAFNIRELRKYLLKIDQKLDKKLKDVLPDKNTSDDEMSEMKRRLEKLEKIVTDIGGDTPRESTRMPLGVYDG